LEFGISNLKEFEGFIIKPEIAAGLFPTSLFKLR